MATATPTGLVDNHSLLFTIGEIVDEGDGTETVDQFWSSVPNNGTADVAYFHRHYEGVTHEYWNPGGRSWSFTISVKNVSSVPVYIYLSYKANSTWASRTFGVSGKNHTTGYLPLSASATAWQVDYLNPNDIFWTGFGMQQGANIGRSAPFADDGYLTISMVPASYYTPTPSSLPTVTPSALGYCGVVDSDSDPDSGFELPVITGGEPICRGAGGFIIPFSWFQIIGFDLDDLIVPQINMCFVPTSFGKLTIAHNVIDLDIAAYIVGALLLFSFVRK